jgi:GAF domain-containing protein
MESGRIAVACEVIQDSAGYTRLIALVETGGARAAVFTPLLKDNEVIGILVVFRQEVGPFTDKHLVTFCFLSSVC